MNKFNFSNGVVCNYVLVGTETEQIVVIVQTEHTVDGERLYCAIDQQPSGIEVYTEKLIDLSERYDIPKETLFEGIKAAYAILKKAKFIEKNQSDGEGKLASN